MKKSFLLLLFTMVVYVAFGQSDTTAVEPGKIEAFYNKVLDWLATYWWAIIGAWEFLGRIIPTKWNVAPIALLLKVLDFLIKNRRVPDGTENLVPNTDGKKNLIEVDVDRHIVK